MGPGVAYPIEDMIAIANDLRQFLMDQWAKHEAAFLAGDASFAAKTDHLGSFMPDHVRQETQAQLTAWHHEMQKLYDQYFALADLLDNGAGRMQLVDHQGMMHAE